MQCAAETVMAMCREGDVMSGVIFALESASMPSVKNIFEGLRGSRDIDLRETENMRLRCLGELSTEIDRYFIHPMKPIVREDSREFIMGLSHFANYDSVLQVRFVLGLIFIAWDDIVRRSEKNKSVEKQQTMLGSWGCTVLDVICRCVVALRPKDGLPSVIHPTLSSAGQMGNFLNAESHDAFFFSPNGENFACSIFQNDNDESPIRLAERILKVLHGLTHMTQATRKLRTKLGVSIASCMIEVLATITAILPLRPAANQIRKQLQILKQNTRHAFGTLSQRSHLLHAQAVGFEHDSANADAWASAARAEAIQVLLKAVELTLFDVITPESHMLALHFILVQSKLKLLQEECDRSLPALSRQQRRKRKYQRLNASKIRIKPIEEADRNANTTGIALKDVNHFMLEEQGYGLHIENSIDNEVSEIRTRMPLWCDNCFQQNQGIEIDVSCTDSDHDTSHAKALDEAARYGNRSSTMSDVDVLRFMRDRVDQRLERKKKKHCKVVVFLSDVENSDDISDFASDEGSNDSGADSDDGVTEQRSQPLSEDEPLSLSVKWNPAGILMMKCFLKQHLHQSVVSMIQTNLLVRLQKEICAAANVSNCFSQVVEITAALQRATSVSEKTQILLYFSQIVSGKDKNVIAPGSVTLPTDVRIFPLLLQLKKNSSGDASPKFHQALTDTVEGPQTFVLESHLNFMKELLDVIGSVSVSELRSLAAEALTSFILCFGNHERLKLIICLGVISPAGLSLALQLLKLQLENEMNMFAAELKSFVALTQLDDELSQDERIKNLEQAKSLCAKLTTYRSIFLQSLIFDVLAEMCRRVTVSNYHIQQHADGLTAAINLARVLVALSAKQCRDALISPVEFERWCSCRLSSFALQEPSALVSEVPRPDAQALQNALVLFKTRVVDHVKHALDKNVLTGMSQFGLEIAAEGFFKLFTG